tara:strand:- start:692 stop:973 length:282 start_codon:yes stop_codon:yes gene_type:complete
LRKKKKSSQVEIKVNNQPTDSPREKRRERKRGRERREREGERGQEKKEEREREGERSQRRKMLNFSGFSAIFLLCTWCGIGGWSPKDRQATHS